MAFAGALPAPRGHGYHVPRRPFSTAYDVQQRRNALRAGASTPVHRHRLEPVQAKAEGVGDIEERQASSESASSSGFSGLVSNLLFGVMQSPCAPYPKCSLTFLSPAPTECVDAQAASSLERGDATCAQCRGTGVLTCPTCKGAGIMKQKVRMNQLRHAMNKVKVLVGMEGSSMYDTQWQMSNRCRRCKGQGQTLCTTCGGLGSRGPRARRQLVSRQATK